MTSRSRISICTRVVSRERGNPPCKRSIYIENRRLLKVRNTELQKLLMLLGRGCLDLEDQPQKLLNFF